MASLVEYGKRKVRHFIPRCCIRRKEDTVLFRKLLFSTGVSGKSLALARRAFLFSLRRRCTKSLPSEVSLPMFTSSSSVLFLILFGVFIRFMVVFVQLPTELSPFTGRTPESLPKSPSDHMVPTLVVALPLLLLSYTYFN